MPTSSARGGLFLLLGSDRARKLQRVQAFERLLDVGVMDQHHLDASSIDSAELVACARQQPAQGLFRLIVVDRAEKLSRDCIEALVQNEKSISRTACVIALSDSLNKRHALSSYRDSFTTEEFLQTNASAQKPFALADALGGRNTSSALNVFHDQLRGGKEVFEILGLIVWQMQRWIMVRRLLDEKCPDAQIAAVAKMRPWQIQRIKTELKSRSLEGLQGILKRCLQVDRDSKSGRTIPQLAVEQLIIEICEAEGSKESRLN